MSGITDRELNSIAASMEEFMPERIIIRRNFYVGGDEEYVPGTVADDVPARFKPGFGMWRSVADRFTGISPYTVTVPRGTDVKIGDQLLQPVGDTDDTVLYQVRDVRDQGTFKTQVKILADRHH